MDDYKSYDPALMSIKKLNNYGRNSGSTLRENRELLIRMIKNAGSITRQRLAEGSGLQRATITIIINELLERNIVEKDGMIDGEHGRRVVRLRLVNRFCAVSVRLNPAYISVAVYDIRMNCLYSSKTFRNLLVDLSAACDFIAAEINKAREAMHGTRMLGIAVGIEGAAFHIVNNRYQHFNDATGKYFDIGKELAKRTDSLVVINRMSNFAAYNIWQNTARMDIGTLATLNVSYTVECGIVVNGEILNGEHGVGGLIGNLSLILDDDGAPRQLNDRISACALLDRACALVKEYPDTVLSDVGDSMNIRDLIRAYLDGDVLAEKVYGECASDCGKVVAILVRLLDPAIVFLGDEIPLSEAFFMNVGGHAARYLEAQVESSSKKGLISVDIKAKHGTVKLQAPDSARGTKNDPSLQGAAAYVFDAAIGMNAFYENEGDAFLTRD